MKIPLLQKPNASSLFVGQKDVLDKLWKIFIHSADSLVHILNLEDVLFINIFNNSLYIIKLLCQMQHLEEHQIMIEQCMGLGIYHIMK